MLTQQQPTQQQLEALALDRRNLESCDCCLGRRSRQRSAADPAASAPSGCSAHGGAVCLPVADAERRRRLRWLCERLRYLLQRSGKGVSPISLQLTQQYRSQDQWGTAYVVVAAAVAGAVAAAAAGGAPQVCAAVQRLKRPAQAHVHWQLQPKLQRQKDLQTQHGQHHCHSRQPPQVV